MPFIDIDQVGMALLSDGANPVSVSVLAFGARMDV